MMAGVNEGPGRAGDPPGDPQDESLGLEVRGLLEKRRRTGTGSPPELVRRLVRDPAFPQSPDAVRQLEDAFGPFRRGRRGTKPAPGARPEQEVEFDYDDIVQQSFPASDPPPPPD